MHSLAGLRSVDLLHASHPVGYPVCSCGLRGRCPFSWQFAAQGPPVTAPAKKRSWKFSSRL